MSEPYTPPTKKSFSLKALALWGERLASGPVSDWENLFTEDALYTGRRLYRESKIAEIILGAEDAAVIFRVPATTPSAFLQILFDFDENGNIHWRSSLSAPRRESAPFAVAGLYVIEEFVASEYPNLPLSADGEKSATKEKSPEGKKPESAVPVPTRPDRELRLIFSSGENELSFSTEWFDSAGKKESALKTDDAQKTLTSGEREQLIRLVAAARKSGFVFKSERDAYVLAGTAQATRFVNEFFPVWQKRFNIKAGLELGAFSQSVREIDARLRLNAESRNAFGLKWDFSLDGNAFSESEIRTLLKHRGENVFLPGRGIVRLRTSARTIADDWPDAATHGIPVYTLLSLFRNGENDTFVPDSKLRSWRRNFLKEPETPVGLPEFLRPYQARGVAWIRQMFARGAHPLLADEMGLGKTLQTLALLSLDTTPRRPALIVCPASVIPVWKSEIRKFFPQLSVCILGTDGDFKRRAGKADARTKPHIWLSSYGMLRIHAELLPKKRFSCAVLDEAQYIKNPQAKITQVCLKIVADKRLALTGTPIENRHLDLWTVFRFLMPGLLGRRATLENELADPDDAYALEKLKTQIAPFILRRTKQEVARELPGKVQTVLHCPLTPEQRERYEQIVREGLASAPAGESVSQNLSQNPTNLLTLLMRLRQAACDPALLPGQSALPVNLSGKITVLLDRLEEIIDNGGKVVVFSQFVSLLDRAREAIEKRFAGTPVFTLTGKTLDRATPVREFQEHKGAGIFLVSLRAGGTGLTLHSAEYVFLLDPWWNPAVEEQAIDRVHRIGQTRRVFVYRMVSAGTIEERIEKLKQSKRAMFDTLVGALPDMSDWASHYPSLESLIALSE